VPPSSKKEVEVKTETKIEIEVRRESIVAAYISMNMSDPSQDSDSPSVFWNIFDSRDFTHNC
jgi:hypothetical protein